MPMRSHGTGNYVRDSSCMRIFQRPKPRCEPERVWSSSLVSSPGRRECVSFLQALPSISSTSHLQLGRRVALKRQDGKEEARA